VRARPHDLTDSEVLSAIADGWGVHTASAAYLPVGGGSHHWRVSDPSSTTFFVTVDDLDDKDWLGHTRDAVLQGTGRALATAAALHEEAGLRFVVAPLPSTGGRVIRRLGPRYALSVYPFLLGTTFPFGRYAGPGVRRQVLGMLVALHGATTTVADLVPVHEPTVGHREDLEAFLQAPSRPWDGGPFSEPAQEALAAQVEGLLAVVAGFDRVVEATPPARQARVVTHGEPHPANVMSVGSGLVLVDWDTVALAPPERDLALVVEAATEDAHFYEAATGHAVEEAVMTLYALRWYLDDVASAVHLFSRPHNRTEDTQHWWDSLASCLSMVGVWRQRLN
jgi:spectinomycin phosphotransferase